MDDPRDITRHLLRFSPDALIVIASPSAKFSIDCFTMASCNGSPSAALKRSALRHACSRHPTIKWGLIDRMLVAAQALDYRARILAAVPEGLPLLATIAQVNAARRLAGHGVLTGHRFG